MESDYEFNWITLPKLYIDEIIKPSMERQVGYCKECVEQIKETVNLFVDEDDVNEKL